VPQQVCTQPVGAAFKDLRVRELIVKDHPRLAHLRVRLDVFDDVFDLSLSEASSSSAGAGAFFDASQRGCRGSR
jgi:hypothetical protein